MRGQALGEREARRLLRRQDVRILHAYGPEPKEVTGSDLNSLLARLDEFLTGVAAPTTAFHVADFRDADRHVLLVIEESC
jgi:hypothetical protein